MSGQTRGVNQINRTSNRADSSRHLYLDRSRVSAEVLNRLELDITMRLDGVLQGDYTGLVPGHGSDPGEARRYSPGDDVRRIDWNVSARMQETFVRQSIADRELETVAVIDLTPSVDFGTAGGEKRELVAAATAAVGILTLKVGNRFGAEIMGADGIISIPSRQGRDHVMAIVERVLTWPRSTTTSVTLAQGIAALRGPQRRRGLKVIISDFIDSSGWQNELSRLALGNQTLAIEVLDPRELELPNVGTINVVDPETGRRRTIRTGSKKLREKYAQAALEQRAAIKAALRQTQTRHLELATDRDWLFDFVRFVESQKKLRTL